MAARVVLPASCGSVASSIPRPAPISIGGVPSDTLPALAACVSVPTIQGTGLGPIPTLLPRLLDQKVERGGGVVVPGTKHCVEFSYRLAKPIE
jgi:hypothetical protein